MPTQKRPKDEAPATVLAADDTFLIDGATNGVRALPGSYFASNFAPIPNLDREIRLDAPIAYWPMTEAGTGFSDAIYGDRTLTPAGTFEYQGSPLGMGVAATPAFSNAASFAGTDQPVGLADLSGEFTVEFCTSFSVLDTGEGFYPFSISVPGGAASEANNCLGEVGVIEDSGHITVTYGFEHGADRTRTTMLWGGLPLVPAEVYHVAVVRKDFGSGLFGVTAYANGVALARYPTTAVPTGGANATMNSTGSLALVSPTFNAGYLAFYDKTLTPTRIMAHAVNLARA